jgi:DNA-directed RNA polymerase specialized sigma24 family protein
LARLISDEQLLSSREPEAFGIFYARYRVRLERYFAARVEDRETAADLAAETVASALVARRRFVPGATPAAGWLYTIAARRLVDHRRRAAVDRRRHEALATTVSRFDDASAIPEPDAHVPIAFLRALPTSTGAR